MTIIVKKPFSIEDIRSEGIKDINTKDFNDTNKQQIHPEFEEKPVLPSTSQSSEETHGGSELTFSLPNSSQSKEQEQQQNGTSSPSNADTNNDNAADNSDNKGAQEQQNEKSNDNNEVGVMLPIIVIIRVPRNNKMKNQMIIMRWEITRLIRMWISRV